MSDMWHGQVIDRVVSADMCRLDVWVFERDRAVLIATASRNAPAIGSLVVGEPIGDSEVQVRAIASRDWPADMTPLIPPDRDSGMILPVMSLDSRQFEIVGEIGSDADIGSDGDVGFSRGM